MAKNHNEITKLKNFYLAESTNEFRRIKQEFKVRVKQLKLVDETALMGVVIYDAHATRVYIAR